ncbi:MAG: EamA family transporter [Anaplasmataceae bacterium]|nr:EamA family transporter [Anaplasmataceae bacterium]
MQIHFFIGVSSVLFATWPLVVRYSGMPPAYMAVVVGMTMAITTVVGLLFQPVSKIHPEMMFFCILGGVMNGIGVMAFSRVIAHTTSPIPIGIVMALVPVIGLVAATIMFSQPMSLMRMLGIILVGVGIYLIK